MGGVNPEKLKVSSFVCVSVPTGQKILHHRSDVLETVVLINPSDEAVSTEVGIQLRGVWAGPHTATGPSWWPFFFFFLIEIFYIHTTHIP